MNNVSVSTILLCSLISSKMEKCHRKVLLKWKQTYNKGLRKFIYIIISKYLFYNFFQ